MGATSCKLKASSADGHDFPCSDTSVLAPAASEYVSPKCLEMSAIRKKCRQLPKYVHPPSGTDSMLPPCAGGVGLFPPCPVVRDATHMLEIRKPPSFAVKPGVREFIRKARDEQNVNANWRGLIEDIRRETDPCPTPLSLKGEDTDTCFPPPPPPPPPPNAWKKKCAEAIRKRVPFEKPEFPSTFGPGGDACVAATPLEDLDPAELWKDASKTRNHLIERRNALTTRYNTASAELDQLLQDSVELRQQLMRVRCSNGFHLNDPEPASERHLGEALQMARDTVSFQDWEVRQLDELLGTLTLLEHDARRRSQKTYESFDILSTAMPNVLMQVKACRRTKRNALDDMAKLLGEMAGLLDRCVRLPIHQWRQTKTSLKPAIAIFQKAMGDFKCGKQYSPPAYLLEFLRDSGLPYARDHDAIDKFLADSTLMNLMHDLDMVFEFLTTLAKQTTDQGMNAIREADLKEIYRPWTTMFKDDLKADDCSMLPPRKGKF